jgi:iron complex transport system ATP-binding protein
LLQADKLAFAYGRAPVLSDIRLSVARGALVGILGPNGSGKTTLLRLLAGALQPLAGRVLLGGREVARLRRTELARRMAVVPQETHLAFDYTVLEIVLMGRHPHLSTFQVEGPHDIGIARHALAATGTADLEARWFNTLSGGEKQRVIIASALAQLSAEGSDEHTAGVLLLDEPTASLDLGYQLEISELLRRLNQDRGVTILVCTHDLNFAAGLCRELILIRRGEVLASGATPDVLTPRAIRELYGVEALVQRDDHTGQLRVLPISLAPEEAGSRCGA